jgi:hypothetical protein
MNSDCAIWYAEVEGWGHTGSESAAFILCHCGSQDQLLPPEMSRCLQNQNDPGQIDPAWCSPSLQMFASSSCATCSTRMDQDCEHSSVLKNIHNLAEEQFWIALEHERQERRWASGQTLDQEWSESMIKEQQAILDKIERERKDKVAQSSSSSSQPTAGTSESHTSGGHPTERATWTPQEPTGSEHEVDYFAARLAN